MSFLNFLGEFLECIEKWNACHSGQTLSLQAFLSPSEIIERSNKNLADSSLKFPDFVKPWLFQSSQYRLFVLAKKGLN
jgi:hypothetical protein